MSTSFSVTNPAVQKDKYKDLANIYADLTPEEQQAIKEKMTPAERDDLIKQLEGKTFTNPAGPMPVYEPTDILTEARRLQGKYFGKTVESPGFEQRNRLDELLRMSPEQRAAEIADFQAGRPAPEPVRAPMDMTEPEPPVQIPPTSEPVPPPTPPSTEPPVRIPPNPTPTEEARARPSMTEAELAQRRAELETVLGRRSGRSHSRPRCAWCAAFCAASGLRSAPDCSSDPVDGYTHRAVDSCGPFYGSPGGRRTASADPPNHGLHGGCTPSSCVRNTRVAGHDAETE